jgi:hypothetical protein
MSNEEIESTLNEAPTLDDLVRVIREGQCLSVSGRSTLTYQLGQLGDDGEHYVRIHDNTGRGMFARDWVSAEAIRAVLEGDAPLTSSAFRPLYLGRSINTGGFLMAALRDLGVIGLDAENNRLQVRNPDVPLDSVFTPNSEVKPKRKSKGGK